LIGTKIVDPEQPERSYQQVKSWLGCLLDRMEWHIRCGLFQLKK